MKEDVLKELWNTENFGSGGRCVCSTLFGVDGRLRMFAESSLVFAMAAGGGVVTVSVLRARTCTIAASSLCCQGGVTRFSCGSRQVGIVLSRGSGLLRLR